MDSQGNGENVLKDAENFQETEMKEMADADSSGENPLEADTSEDNADFQKNGTRSPEDGEDSQNAPQGDTNALAQKLQVPDRYVASAEEGIFSLDCDAEILVPDVEKVSV